MALLLLHTELILLYCANVPLAFCCPGPPHKLMGINMAHPEINYTPSASSPAVPCIEYLLAFPYLLDKGTLLFFDILFGWRKNGPIINNNTIDLANHKITQTYLPVPFLLRTSLCFVCLSRHSPCSTISFLWTCTIGL